MYSKVEKQSGLKNRKFLFKKFIFFLRNNRNLMHLNARKYLKNRIRNLQRKVSTQVIGEGSVPCGGLKKIF